MAGIINDPRFEMARLMRRQAQLGSSGYTVPLAPAPSKAAVQLGRTAISMGVSNPTLRQQLDAIASGQPQPDNKGLIGSVVNSMPGKFILNGLNALSIPGRAVVSTMREITDAVDQDPETKASFSDFKSQVSDPTFGFGKAFSEYLTGNIWIDRGIGFLGDVFTDPLTATTFGGGKFAGYAGRLDLAEAILKTTGDARLANRVQKFGRAAVKDSTILERVGANRHGLYMFGKKIRPGKPIRIPGTGAIGYVSDNLLTRLRTGAMGTKPGKFLQKITLPRDALAARQALLQGNLGDDAASAVIAHLTADAPARMAQGTTLAMERQALLKMFEVQESLGLEGYANDLYKYMEKPELLRTAPDSIREAYDYWRPFFQQKEDEISRLVNEVDPISEFAGRDNYFPMIHSDDARAYLNDPSNKHYNSLREIYSRDPLEGGGNFKTRTLRPGDDWFGHPLTQADIDGGIQKLNEIASRPGTGFTGNFFETDLRKVLPKYIEEYSKEVGVLARHKHLVDRGFWKRAENVMLGENIVDRELVSSIKAQVSSLQEELRNAVKQVGKSHADLVDAIVGNSKAAKEALDAFNAAGGRLGAAEELATLGKTIDEALTNSIMLTSDSIESLAKHIGVSKSRLVDIFGGQIVNGKVMFDAVGDGDGYVIDGLLSHMDSLEQELFSLRTEMFVIDQDVVGKDLKKLAEDSEKKLALALQRVKDSQKTLERAVEFGNQLNSAVSKYLAGDGTGAAIGDVLDSLTLMGMDPLQAASTVESTFMRAQGAKGGMAETFEQWMRRPEGLYSRATRHTKIAKDKISRKTPKEFFDDIPRLIAGDVSMDEARELSLWVLFRDQRIYGGRIPKPILKMRQQLIDRLLMADSASSFVRDVTKEAGARGQITGRKMFETRWSNVINEVLLMQEDLKGIDDFLLRAQTSSVNLNDIVDWDSLDYSTHRFLNDHTPDSFGDNFMFYADDMRGKELTNQPLNAESLDSTMRFSERNRTDITYRELIENVKSHKQYIQRRMSDPENGFEMYSGAAKRKYSGKEVIEMHNEYYGLMKRRNEILDMRTAKRDAILENRRKIEKDIVSLRSRKQQAQNLPPTARNKYWTPEMERRLKQAEKTISRPIEAKLVDNELTFAQLSPAIEKEYADVTAKINEIANSNALMNIGLDGSVKQIQDELSNALIQYTIVSEVTARWNGVTEIFGAYGLTPTQSVFADITSTVGKKFLPHLEAQRTNVIRAQNILERLDAEVASRFLNEKMTGKTAGRIFSEAVDAMPSADRELLASVLGPSFRAGSDPREIRKGLKTARSGKRGSAYTAAENEYVERVVRPWFEASYPERMAGKKVGKDEMIRVLDSLVDSLSEKGSIKRANQTPWASDADITVVRSWFEEHIPFSQIPGSKRYTTYVDGEAYRVVGAGVGTFRAKISTLRAGIKNMEQLLAPDLNIQKFLDDPLVPQTTPTLYSKMIEERIDKLTEMIDARRGGRRVLQETEEQVDSAAEIADKMRRQNAALEGRVFGPVREEDLNPNVVKKFKQARERAVEWQKLDDAVVKVQDELDGLRDRISPLASKKRTKTGLTSREQKELDGLYARQRKAKAKLKDAQKSRSRVSKPSAQELEMGQVEESKMLSQARKTLAEYNMKSRHAQNSRALDDQEMVKVLDALSGFDLSEFTKGFMQAGGSFASFANGKRIVFSKEEWQSLFRPNVGGETVEQINTQLSKLQGTVLRLSKSKNEWTRRLQSAIAAPMEFNVERAKFQLDEIEKALTRAAETKEELMFEKLVANPATQQSALEKLRVLVFDTIDGPAVLGGKNLESFLKFEHPAFAGLNSVFRAGENYTEDLWKSLVDTREQARNKLARAKRELAQAQIDFGDDFPEYERALLEKSIADAKAEQDVASKALSDLYMSKRRKTLANEMAARKTEEGGDAFGSFSVSPAAPSKQEIEAVLRRNITPEKLAERKRIVRQNWESSDEFKFLQEINELEKNIFVSIHKYNMQGLEGMVKERDRLVSLLKQQVDAYNTAHPLEDIQAMVGTSGTIANMVKEADSALMQNTGRFVAAQGDKAVESIDAAGKRISKLIEDKAKLVEANRGTKYKTGTQKKIDAIDEEIAKLQDEVSALSSKVSRRLDVRPPRTREEVMAYVEEVRRLASERGPLFEEIPGVRGRRIDAAAQELIQNVDEVGRWRNLKGEIARVSKENAQDVVESRNAVMRIAKEKASRLESANSVLKALRSKDEAVLAEMVGILGLPVRSAEVVPEFVREQFWNYLSDQRALAAGLQKQLDEAEALVALLPDKEIISAIRKVSGGRASKEVAADALRRFKIWQRDNRQVFEALSSDPENPVYKAWAAAGIAENDFIMANVVHRNKMGELMVARTGEWAERVVTPLADEWEEAARRTGLLSASEGTGAQEGFFGLTANKEALDLIRSIERIREPGTIEDLSRFMRGYTGFFRAYATLSPGFHVRNSISNVFSLFSAGADIKNMYDGFRLWRLLDRELTAGGTIDSFLSSLPESERKFAQVASEIMFGLNGGKVDDALQGFTKEGGSTIRDNWAIRTSHKMGNKAEGSARFMLAYDSLVKGYETGHAFNRTRRYLIDYGQKTILDNMMRDIIPFWTWMSRNLPLQVVNRWANPKPYLLYEKFARNMSEGESPDNVTPMYLKAMGAIGLGGGKYITPDLPFTRVDEQIGQFANPKKILGYVNPGIKTPIELLTNTDTFTGKQFENEYVPVNGVFNAFIPLIQATGQLEYDEQGNPVMTKKAMSALMNTIPLLGRTERLFPSSGAGSPGNAFNSFIGLPITNVSAQKQDAERYRRIAAMQELVNKQKSIREAQ